MSNTKTADSTFLNLLDITAALDNYRFRQTDAYLDLAADVRNIQTIELAKLPFHLNLLQSATEGRLRETAHTRFIWNLLRVPKIMDSFMSTFLNEAYRFEKSCRINHPERFHMDISIEGNSHFFIVENKVNDAPEQCGQIYRYVSLALQNYKADHIHVLYLNSSTHDLPSDYSLSKDGKGKEFIPDDVHIKTISYKDEIAEWLDSVYSTLPDNETYLKSAIYQYSDYLKEYFNISTRHKDMNKKFESLIKDRIFTENMNTVEKLNAISDMDEQIDELKSYLEKLKERQQCLRFQEWFKHLTKIYPLDEYSWKRNSDTDIHLEFDYHGYRLAACLTIDNGLCWGIRNVNRKIPNEWASDLRSEIQVHLPKVRQSEWWPAWDYTSFENGLDRFLTLLDCVSSIKDK